MWFHSASDRSVGYLFLMRARVAKYPPRTTFHTVSLRGSVNRGIKRIGAACLNWPEAAPGGILSNLVDGRREADALHEVLLRSRARPRDPQPHLPREADAPRRLLLHPRRRSGP